MERYYRNKRAIWGFLLPALVVYLVFEVVPVLLTIGFSFAKWPGIQSVPLQYVGLENYRQLFTDSVFLKSLRNIAIYVVISVLLQIPIGFALGFAVHSLKWGKRLFKAAFFIPMILSVTAVALLWNFIYFPTEKGILNSVLIALGLGGWTRQWLVDTNTSLMCLIVVTTWTSVGYYMIICLAGLTAIPEDIVEAGALEGCTGLKKISYIYLPMLMDSLKVSTVMVITGVLKIFDTVYILTPTGGTDYCTIVPALLMYNEAYRYNNYGTGSAIATVIFALSVLTTSISLWLMNRRAGLDA